MKKLSKVLLLIFAGIFGAFSATFTIYFFNLDMKLIALIEPFMQKWYDALPRKQSV